MKFGDETHSNALWDIGNKIVQKLVKKRYEIGPTVIETLNDKIMCGNDAVYQYTSELKNLY